MEIVLIVFISVFVGLPLMDLFFAATWNKIYFTAGLTIYVKRVPINRYHTNKPSLVLLEKKFHSDEISSLVFGEINSNSYGFRNKLFEFRWIRIPSLMHGLLIFDKDKSQVVVKGFMDWTIAAIFLIFTGIPIFNIANIVTSVRPLDLDTILFSLVMIGVFVLMNGISYLLQVSMFSKVASYAAELWARKHVQFGDEA